MLVGFFLRLHSRNQLNITFLRSFVPLGRKATGLKATKQDQVQFKCRTLFSTTAEKNLFQSEAQMEEHTNRKHPFPTTPQ